MNVIIIGGGATGASCATRLRRLNEFANITIIEKTNEISIANCGLPYYISDTINKRDNMIVSSINKFQNWFNINVRLNTEVIKIDLKNKIITLNNNEELKYDKLVLALGATPIFPHFEGIDYNKTFMVKTLEDADKIKTYIKTNNVQNAVVVGSGFIGVEIAENLNHLGLKVTLIEQNNQILNIFDEEISSIAQNKMKDNKIELILSDGIKKIDGNKIILNSGKEIAFDIIIMATGVKPETKIASCAGLKVNRGIIVNEYMLTSDPNVFAGGDCIEVKDFVTDNLTLIPLAGPANRQGRIIADNIIEKKSTYKKSLGTAVIKIFDFTAASVGNNEKQLKSQNIHYWKTFIYGLSHAGYYPHSNRILFKLLFSNDGKILGAQAIGQKGVEKRIDIISTIMRNNGTIQEMIDSELCYAPPYSLAKDPINILGMVAHNILKGYIKPAYFEDLKNAHLIDVRIPEAFKEKTIPDSINIPISDIRKNLNKIPKDKKVILFCNTGYTSYCASRILIQNGFDNVFSLMGGIELYKELINNKENNSNLIKQNKVYNL